MQGIVKTDRFEMAYAKFGSGARNFVIIPGVSLKPVVPMESALEAAFAAFKQDYTIYIFDRKMAINEPYSVKEMADDTAEAMKQLGITDAYIFGASQGGMISLTLALDHPELVHAEYLASTLSKPNEISQNVLTEWLSLAKSQNAPALCQGVNSKIYSKEYFSAFKEAFNSMPASITADDMHRLACILEPTLSFNVYDRLNEIKCPTFVVSSWKDEVLSAQGGLEIAEKLHCPLYIYQGYSHALYDEAPDFRPAMLAALATV